MTALAPRLVLLVLVTLAALPLAACGQRPAEAQEDVVRPVLSVIAHPVTRETVGPYVGDIEPRYQTPLSFQTSGRIISRPVQVGDTVTKGEQLASLDAAVQQFQLASAQADVASAQSTFNNLSAAEERAKSLVATGASAQAQLDSATSARETAAAQLAQAKASLARAQNELTFTAIIAGFDGVVVAVGAEVGQVVSAGETVVTIARPDVREAVFELPEAEAKSVAPDSRWTVSLVDAPNQLMQASVREISPLISASTRTQTVRLSLADPPPAFRIGATVNVASQREVSAQYPLPPTALLEQDGKTLVWLVDPKSLKVSQKLVAVGARTDERILVTNGLSDGDRVVVAGVHSLTDGEVVKLDGEAP
ncbi:MAG TPA: efflux RND transporter periplasmic adaptor subunit [Devosiaceae bacterium]|jgi:RND family efflux transporter MFP subunit|nr:efflux RND transporter periplasmic adaptor subunit [Devosiaceae bacterium]